MQAAINDRTGRSNIDVIGPVDGRLTGNGWHAIANPVLLIGIEAVSPLGGSILRFEWAAPNIESDDVFYLVGGDWAVLAVDYRTLAYNAGA